MGKANEDLKKELGLTKSSKYYRKQQAKRYNQEKKQQTKYQQINKQQQKRVSVLKDMVEKEKETKGVYDKYKKLGEDTRKSLFISSEDRIENYKNNTKNNLEKEREKELKQLKTEREKTTKNYQESSETYKEYAKEKNKSYLTQHLADKEKVENEEVTTLDKLNIVRPYLERARDAIDDNHEYILDNGSKVSLPTYGELKEEKVMSEMGTIGQAIHSAAGSLGANTPAMITSLATSAIPFAGKPLSRVTGGVMTYATIYNSAKNQKLLEGYSEKEADNYAKVNASLETGLSTAIGGFSKAIGGNGTLLTKGLAKISDKILKNEGTKYFVSHLVAEEVEELTQMVLDPINEHVTLGEYENLAEALSTIDKDEALITALSTLFSIGLTEGPTAVNINALSKNIDAINKEYGTDFRIKPDSKQIMDSETNKKATERFEELKKKSKISKYQEQQITELETRAMQVESDYETGKITEEQYKEETQKISNEAKIFKQEQDNNEVNPITEIEAEKEMLDEKFNSNLITEQEYDKQVTNLNKKLKKIAGKDINNTKYSQNEQQTPYQYEETDNTKVNNMKQSASQYFDNAEDTHELIDTYEKIIVDKNYNVLFDDTITNIKGESVNAKITTLENGEVEIRINPNSERAGEFLIIHEVTHAIETDSLKQLVIDFAKQNKDFDKALTDLKRAYGTEDVSSEVLADISGQLLGNQEFINSLTMQNTLQSKNIIKQIYESIVRTLNKLTTKGRYRNFVQDLETKWREAYQTQENNLSEEIKYHVNKDINKNVDNVLKNINERNPVKLRDYTPKILVDNGIKDLPMYENPSHIRKNILTEQEAKQLGLSIGTRDHYHGLGKDIYIKAIDSLDNPRVIFKNKNGKDYLILTMIKDKNNNNIVVPIEIQTETYINRIRIDTNRIKSVYGYEKVNNIDLNEYIKNNLKKQKFQKIYEQKKGRGTGFSTAAGPLSNNNIPQNDKNVKSDISSTKYSMQGNKNNTQELDNSSFSLEKLPKVKNGYTRLYRGLNEKYDANYDRSKLDSPNGYDTLTDNYDLAKQYGNNVYYIDIPTNQISNSVIDENPNSETYGDRNLAYKNDKPAGLNGVSGNEYLLYTDHDNFNSKDYHKVENGGTKYSISDKDNQGRILTKEQQEYFKDSKVRDEQGRLLEVYHGTPNGGFTIFDINKTSRTELKSQFGTGFYFTNDSRAASDYNYDEDIYGNTVIGEKPKTYTTYLNIKNPLMLNVKNMNEHNLDRYKIKEFLLRGDNDYFFDNYISFITQTPDALNYKVDGLSREEINNLSKEDRVDYWLRGTYDLKNFGDKNFLQTMHRAYKNNSDLIDNFKDIFGYDGIIVEGAGNTNQYIAFEPNQIKNIDNTKPTSDTDIRYSQENQTWQEHLEENYKATGTRTNFSDIRQKTKVNEVEKAIEPVINDIKTITDELKAIRKDLGLPERQITSKKIMNPNEISKLTKEDANTTPKLPNKKVSTGKGKSKFADNIMNKTDMLEETSKEKILSQDEVKYYEEVTNKESLDKAFDRLENGGASETMSWFNKDSKNADSTDVAEGWILMKQYQDNKDYDGMVQVAKKLREIGTKAGQTVQAFNIMERMTPEGMVKYAQSELSEAYDKMVKNKTRDWIENNRDKFDLTPSEVEFIMNNMEEISTMEDGYDKKVKLAEIQKLMTDKLPPERGAGMKAWMRISMLFNPKTQVRNVLGNATIAPVNAVADTFASMVDRAISKKTGVRTTGMTNLSSYGKGMKEGLYQSYNDFKKGINTRNIQGNRFEIGEGKSFNDSNAVGKALNRVDSLLSFMLDAGDRTFYEASFTNSINNQLVLNKTDVVTQDMIDIATTEALQRTWQDNNTYTKGVLQIRKFLNNANIKGYGLGDVLIPFAKTPANLTKALIDYSPAGMITTITSGINLNRSLSNGQYTAQMQHKFVQNLGKATAGTMLYVLGYALAKSGAIGGEADEDKDVANFMKNTLGTNNYSIKIGNKSFTYDWAQPVAGAFSIMANYVQKTKESENANKLETLIGSLDIAGNILLQQSFMESINTVLNNNEGFVTGLQESLLELPSRAIPTFSKQIADMIDGTQRTSFEKGEPIETAKNKVISKIPFASKSLAPSVDTLGREIQKYGGKNNIFNVFFNPANVNSENISEAAKEIYRLYQTTGDNKLMPRVAPYNIEIEGKKRLLTSQERTEYQKQAGKIVEDAIKELLKSSTYKKLSDEDKSKTITDIINYAYNKPQEKYGKEIASEYKNADKYVEKGGTISGYYCTNNILKSYEIDYEDAKDNLDSSSSNYSAEVGKLSATKRKNIIDAIINTNVNKEAKAYLYGKYYGSPETINAIVNSGINFNEYLKFVRTEYTSDKDSDGDTIKNSRKNKIFSAINSLKLTKLEKAMLMRTEYSSFDNYNYEIFEYVNKLSLNKSEKQEIFETLGFEVKGGRVYW